MRMATDNDGRDYTAIGALAIIDEVYEAISEGWKTRGPAKTAKDHVLSALSALRGKHDKERPTTTTTPTTLSTSPPAIDVTSALQKQLHIVQQDIATIKAAINAHPFISAQSVSTLSAT